MKQGKAGRDVRESAKVEPLSKAKNIAKVANIGVKQVRTLPYTENGRGFMAPAPSSQKTHKGGSQRKG
jgi:hypothetical protein